MKRLDFPGPAPTQHLPSTYRWSLGRFLSVIRAVTRAVAADHALAQAAAAKAESSRANLAEVRALYVTTPATRRQDDVAELRPVSAHDTPTARRVLADLPAWGTPFPKSMKYR
jgi:hypothetical protein